MIKQEDIGEKTDVWQIIMDILAKYCDIPAYPPATHKGQCTKPYIVIKRDGASVISGYSSMKQYYRVLLYVPKNQYSKLDEYQKKIEKVFEENIFPLVLPTGEEESDYYDDNYDAFMRTMIYRNAYRRKHV